MARKGLVAEIFSKALHVDNPELYTVGYNNLGKIKKVALLEFLNLSENFEVIPASRIAYIMKENIVLYSKKDKKQPDRI
jgi:hypothetical protein